MWYDLGAKEDYSFECVHVGLCAYVFVWYNDIRVVHAVKTIHVIQHNTLLI
jgi:hypothetical protein